LFFPRSLEINFILVLVIGCWLIAKKIILFYGPYLKNYTEYMLGLGKDLWKGVDAAKYVKKERESWKE
jgi:hypothetical protein